MMKHIEVVAAIIQKDGRASVALYAKDGKIWLNPQQMAELFATSKQTISYHIVNILKDKELDKFSVVKEFLTTAADGKKVERFRLVSAEPNLFEICRA